MNPLNLNDMTDEEIRKLAREFAEYSLSEERKMYDDEAYQRLVDESSKGLFDVRYVLQWVLKNFCIVEKEKARELARLTLENGCSEDFGLIDGLVDWVCDNFEDEYREEAEK